MAGEHIRPVFPAAIAMVLVAGGVGAQENGSALFETADRCIACHTGVVAPNGEDVSIGPDWRATMMANSSRDPYWQAAVRREIMDRPAARGTVEQECSVCHMPLAHTVAAARGHELDVFAHVPGGRAADGALGRLAADGVSCALCHQIRPDGLGSTTSFNGHFVIEPASPIEHRRLFGPFDVDSGRARVMASATGFRPERASHIQQSELCASCHTLITTALDANGNAIGRLPEQVPFLEWQHSDYAGQRSCQSCHMPAVADSVPVTGVLGVPRAEVSRHSFRGGNAFMLRMLNRYRDELGVEATAGEMDAAVMRTERHLAEETASLAVENVTRDGSRLRFDVTVTNHAGHKLPTAYPSRRAWLHVTVRDARDRVVFESGAVRPDGAIEGNDNDDDPARYEPHHERIESAADVQIYEAVLGTPDGSLTTGLLSATRFLKDNRLLPRGFEAGTAEPDIAVHGEATHDEDFAGGSDRVQYATEVGSAAGPLRVSVVLRFQPIGFRWARNLADYRAAETDRFVGWYEAMADVSSSVLARASAEAR